MPSRDAIKAAHLRDAKQRNASYGDPVKIGEVEKKGTYNAPQFVKMLESGGFSLNHDAKVRLLKTDWPGYAQAEDFDGKKVSLWLNEAWVDFNVQHPTDAHLSGEWILVLEAH